MGVRSAQERGASLVLVKQKGFKGEGSRLFLDFLWFFGCADTAIETCSSHCGSVYADFTSDFLMRRLVQMLRHSQTWQAQQEAERHGGHEFSKV